MKQQIVSRPNFQECLEQIRVAPACGLDTETFGLRHEQRLFSIQIATAGMAYYFNFFDGEDHLGNKPPEETILPRSWIRERMGCLWADENKTWFIHHAKFDLQKLALEGVVVKGLVHCTQAVERILFNTSFIGLAKCAVRRGLEKDSSVEEYIKKHKLSTKVTVPGKKKAYNNKHFHLVPFDIMTNYGCVDANLHRLVGEDQLDQLEKAKYHGDAPPQNKVVTNELRLVRTVTRIVDAGIMIDRKYCTEALDYEMVMASETIQEQEELVGLPRSETHFLKKAFDKFGYEYRVKQDTGNAIFDKEHLEMYDNPVAKLERKKRNHEKNAGTYYSSFLYFSDHRGILHANPKQDGTLTGRFSYSDPNLQNVPKEDEDYEGKKFLVRGAFKPRPDYDFLMIDYDQMEYRLLLDIAGEIGLIDRIMEEGLCVHQATADMLGKTRKQAKAINFGLLYGQGVEAMAKATGRTLAQTRMDRGEYFSKLPRVAALSHGVKERGKQRGYIYNWFGRRCHLDKPQLAYQLLNHMIQGGCGDIVKIAMNQLDDRLLGGMKSRMLVQVHDEILFEIHKDERFIQAELVDIMQNVYQPRNNMALTCGVEHSKVSWGTTDKVKGFIE